MHTLLFDIDGTLIRTGGAGFVAMRIAMQKMFGVDSLPEVPVHGRTDRGILADIFELGGLDFNQHGASFSELYWEHLPTALEQTPGKLLPGVLELLNRLAERPDFALGILTGNAQRAAEIKLQHFKLTPFFGFGGYGDHHICRDEVAKIAYQSARQYSGKNFKSDSVWVIGDTVNDIRCARAIGSRVLVVETGGSRASDLRSAEPDAQFETLENDRFWQLFD